MPRRPRAPTSTAATGTQGDAAVPPGLPAGWTMVLRLFFPFALGYFLSYFFRTINAVIAPQLIAEFSLDAASVGLLTSVYFLAFAGMQVPIGLLVDRFGPRRVQAALLALAGCGALGFAAGDTLLELTLGRALIGAGVAGSLMVSFSAFVIWLPARRVPAASGLLMAFGGLGAFAAGAPTEAFVAGGGAWRDLFLGGAAATIAVAGLVLLAVPNPQRSSETSLRDLLAGLGTIYSDRMFWKVAPLAIAGCGSAFALQGLWAGPWLMQVAQRDSQAVGVHLSVMGLALIAGSAACGPIASISARFGFSLLQAVAVLGAVYIAALAGLVLQLSELSMLLWGTVGLLANPMAMIYIALSHRFPAAMAARVTTGMNALVLTGSFFMQWVVGRIIVLWDPVGPGAYPAQAFQVSFALVLGCVVAAWFWYLGALAIEGGPGPDAASRPGGSRGLGEGHRQ